MASVVHNNSVGFQDNFDERESNEFLTFSMPRSEDNWVIDTGVAYHMTFFQKIV